MAFSGTKRYVPLRLIGSGGMGEVYEVEDRESGVKVALKVVPNVGGNALVRFKREFRALCDIHHENLVQLFELGSEKDHWFFTMELIDGVDFLSYVCPRPSWRDEQEFSDDSLLVTEPTVPSGRASGVFAGYDEDKLVDSLRQLVRGLMTLHDAGLVHRDVKPGNALVTKAGRVVLLDFGLVKPVDQDELSMDTMGDIAGTIPYMAPELAAGADVTPAVDWYSVGVLVYQALTGRLPFEGPPLDVLIRKQSETPQDPQSLNAECHAGLAAMAMKLLRPDPASRPGGDALLRVLDQVGRRSSSQVSGGTMSLNMSEVFVGRTGELARLASAWGQVLGEDIRVMLIEGESGIGKSRLMDRFLEGVVSGENGRSGFVLRGRCYERESMAYKAFDVVVDRLSLKLARMPEDELAFLLPEDIWYLAAIFPALNRIKLINDARYPRVAAGDPTVARRRAFRSFGSLIAKLSIQEPVLLGIDDLQWADDDSMDLFNAALASWTEDKSHRARVFIVTTMRPRVVSDAVEETVKRLEKQGILDRITLSSLEQKDSEHLVAHLLSSSVATVGGEGNVGWVETIIHESGGNPYLMGEMAQFVRLRSEADDVVPGEVVDLTEVVARRIEELPAESRDILSHVAVAGEPISQDLVADSMGMSRRTSQWRRNVARLRSLRLVRYQGFKGGDIIESYHDRTRQAVLDLMPPDVLQNVHADLARAMERATGVDPETLARHWLAARQPERAKDYLVRAARESMQKLAFGRAASLMASAVELESDDEVRCGLLMEEGEALVNDGRPAEAIDAFTRASASADASLRLRALIQAVSNRLKAGYIRQGLESLQDVLAELGLKMPAPGVMTLVSVAGKRLRLQWRGIEFERRDEMELSGRALARLEVFWTLASSLSLVDPVLSAGFHTRLLLEALDLGLSDYIVVALAIEAGTRASFGASHATEAKRLLVKAEGMIENRSDVRLMGRVTMTKGIVAYFVGDWVRCEEYTKEALDMFRNHAYGMGWEIAGTLSFLGWSLMMMGRLTELSELAYKEMGRARRTGDRLLSANLSTSMGIVWLVADKIDEAERLIEDAIITWPQDRFQIQHYYVLYAKTEFMLYNDRVEEAWEWLEQQIPKLKRALLMRIGIVRQEVLRLRGRVALAMAARAESLANRRRFLKVAAADARRLRKEGYSFTDAWAEHLDAARLWLDKGDVEASALRFSQAVSALDAARLGSQSLAARRSRAVIQSDRDEIDRIDESFRQEGVVKPARIAMVLSPGIKHR